MALPLSKSRQKLTDQISTNLLFLNMSGFWAPNVGAEADLASEIGLRPSIRSRMTDTISLRRRQEVDRVNDRHRLHTFLRAEIDRLDAAHNLSSEIRCFHVRRLQ